MKRLVIGSILAMLASSLASSPARADDYKWDAVFVVSATVALGGAGLWWHGWNEISHAEDQLCAGGALPSCSGQPMTLSARSVNELNDRGTRGQLFTTTGMVMVAVGAGVGVFAAYKAFVAKSKTREPSVAVTPVVSPALAGASLELRW